MPSGSTGQAAWRYQDPPQPPGGGRDRQFDSKSLQQRAEPTVIACLQRIARLKLADAGEDRIGHWIGERIDLHIYAEIRKAATPAHLIDVAVFCASDDPRIGTAPSCRGAGPTRGCLVGKRGRRQSSLAAEVDLRFGAAVELGISDISPSRRPP